MHLNLSCSSSRVLIAAALWIGACGSDGGSGNPGNPDLGTSACGPQNCAGCCLGGVCQPGSTAAGCGGGGGQCAVCPSYQACLPTLQCGLLPSQSWLLAAVSANIAATNNGTPWDADGSPPDPYVLFDGVNQTSVQQNTYTPSWNQGFVYTVQQLQAGVRLQVFDKDLISDDPISAARIFRFGDQDFARGGATVSTWDGVLSISFALQQR